MAATETVNSFNVQAKVAGGGTTGWAGAIRMGIARGLLAAEQAMPDGTTGGRARIGFTCSGGEERIQAGQLRTDHEAAARSGIPLAELPRAETGRVEDRERAVGAQEVRNDAGYVGHESVCHGEACGQ